MANSDDLPRRKVPATSPAPPQSSSYPQFPDGIPRPLSPGELPSKYKPAERRVRVMIIALPIAIVTSWVLWNRLVKGEERKVLVRNPPTPSPPTLFVDLGNTGPTTG
ncbi:hypothetical protein DFP73DRAFT_584966 [Morchella snyderi]|nr:hypothetical protein DFP73DRAFT_584966 [Morchella snyderi]